MKQILRVAAICLSSSLVTAQYGSETLGAFFDTGATQTAVSVGLLEPFDIYILAENAPVGYAGYELYVNMPPEIVILDATPHPIDPKTLDIDPSLEGFIVGIGGPCLTGSGPVVLAELKCMAIQEGTGLPITISPANPSSFGGTAPGYCECGTLALYPFKDAYSGPATVNVSTPRTYCTAKVNTQGCTPAIGFSGSPSVSSSSPFDINAAEIINNKPGILFYGYSAAAFPFQGGYLCVQPPIKRTPPQSSGGNPPPNDCSGAFHFDMNAHIQSGIDSGLVTGVTVFCQYWARDPSDPHTTNLTDALELVIGA